ncbi:hypothetical protein JZ751_021709 [Albula glossodonta]|uniref:Uncharacterized protein n=1 Tax=Albula glossodonta TaxID=121402 RepID=A0A8T2NKR5_9TELE|nr:hypothetical protein JZ751_021709 [Albula glossodonta]
MASTQTLQEHNHNRTGREDTRYAKHPLKGSADVGSRPSKPSMAPKAPKRGAENQDPSARVGKGTATGKQMGSSRLPVLARSQPLQPHTDFTQVHKKWEENFQKGKAQKKKPCTKVAPFSLSQPQASRAATSSQQRVHPTNTGAAKPKCQNISQTARPLPKPATTAPQTTLPATAPHASLPDTAPHTSLPDTAPQNTLPDTAPHAPFSVVGLLTSLPVTASLASLPVTAPHASLPVTAPQASLPVTAPQTSLQHANGRPAMVLSGHSTSDHSVPQSAAPPTAAVHFSPDPAALSSILQNEGVKAGVPFGVTPRSSVCPTGRGTSVYLPQRVSVVKSHPAAGPGSGGTVQFSPDPAALRSILQNEGVKAGGPLGATPKSSVCPTGRGTSVYLPQRVPVAKATGEATTAGAVQSAAALSQTPAVKWTPQRIPNTRPQSMMRHLSSHRTPMFLGSPHLRSVLRPGKDPLGPHKEEPVVQKLFDEEEEEGAEPKVNIGEERVTDRMKDQPATPQTECTPSLSGGGEEEEGSGRSMGKEETGHAQPFIPPPHRESVIVFSSARKVLPMATPQQSHPTVPGSDSLLSHLASPAPSSNTSTDPLPPSETRPTPRGPHGGIIQRIPHLLSGGSALRRRPPPLEEFLLDEECAVFTSCPPAPPAHPRCANPVASLLQPQSSACFVPIWLPPPSTSGDPPPIWCPVVLSV